MTEEISSESVTFRKLIGYIGEQVAEEYLKKQGFEAYVAGDSGIGKRVGDVFIRRKWFHDNGQCQGHWDTFGIEVKATLSNKFHLQLSKRQKRVHEKHRLPILSIKILDIQPSKIEYKVMERPSNWTQSRKFHSWKGEPTYYGNNAPRLCHKFREHRLNSLEDERRWEEQRYLKSIRFIRRALRNIGYLNINSDPLQKTLDYVV